jgi:hypothetical protein
MQPQPTSPLTPDEARRAILSGGRVRLTVGTGHDDPVLVVYADDGMVYSEAVAGWSAGVLEPVCSRDSDFLRTFLTGRHALELAA